MITQYGSEKKNKILNSALELFVEKGFHGTSTSSISKNAGVSTGILFHYFSTKKTLIIELYLNIKERFYRNMIQNLNNTDEVDKSMKKMWDDTIDWVINNRLDFKYLIQYSASPFNIEKHNTPLLDEYDIKTAAFFTKGINEGYFRNINIGLLRNNLYHIIVSLFEVADFIGHINDEIIEQAFVSAVSSIKKCKNKEN